MCCQIGILLRKKKKRKIRMIFDVESQFFALCNKLAKLGKASQEAYNLGKWLILSALMKNWVAKGIASNVNDFTEELFCHWLKN